MTKTDKCKECKHHDPEWREYGQLIPCAHPLIIEAYGKPIWCLYPLETFCRRYDAFEDYDPSPWCAQCGAMTKIKCKCGPIADND